MDYNTKILASTVDELQTQFAHELFKLCPVNAKIQGFTYEGIDSTSFGDWSPQSIEETKSIYEKYLKSVSDVEINESTYSNERISKENFINRTQLSLKQFDIGLDYKSINNISSPIQEIAMMFDLMACQSKKDCEDIAKSLIDSKNAIFGYMQTLKTGLDKGIINTTRQAANGLEYAKKYASDKSSLNNILTSASKIIDDKAVLLNLENALNVAKSAYNDLAKFIENDYLPKTKDIDGVGEEEYILDAQKLVGFNFDLKQMYEWGVSEVERITKEQSEIARKVGATSENDFIAVKQGVEIFDNNPKYKIVGLENLTKWMKETSLHAMEYLIKNDHFEIPSPIDQLDYKISNSNAGMIYYTPASDDFLRKGTMWWGVPENITEFTSWREKTTVYHEGIPGHHLQCSRAIFNKDKLNLFRRAFSWIPGHGEGWALYAEYLMDELGFLSDCADKFGQLFGERMRAARIVIDMGIHLGYKVPKEWESIYGSGAWTYDNAYKLLEDCSDMEKEFVHFELNRYIGWPAQAISYKVGCKKWLQIREKALKNNMPLKEFHTKALDQGCISLDLLEKIFI